MEYCFLHFGGCYNLVIELLMSCPILGSRDTIVNKLGTVSASKGLMVHQGIYIIIKIKIDIYMYTF